MPKSRKSTAERVIDGLGRLRVTQGAGAGGPLSILPWQRRFLRGALSPDRGRAALSVARGNGKTTLAAGIAVAALVGPLSRPRGETIIVASSFQQARIAFDHTLAFLAPAMAKIGEQFRVQSSGNIASIEFRPTGARVRAIGSDPRRAHGLAPALVIADEPAQWPVGTSEAMIAALTTGMGKISDSRLWAIGTMPADEGHWFRRMFGPDGCDYAQLHAAAPDAPATRAVTWGRANPSLSLMPELRKRIAAEAKAAAHEPGLLASFRALRLNLGEHETTRAMLIDADLWERLETPDMPRSIAPRVWGIDLGGTAAFSAVASYDPRDGHLDAVAMIGDDPDPRERGLRDGVGRAYQDMVEEGTLVLARGRTVPAARLLEHAAALWGSPAALSADRWREGELRDALKATHIPPCPVEMRGQGYKDGGEDVRLFRRACASGRVSPRKTRLLRTAMSEAVTVSDPAGNHKLAKNSEGGRRVRARDDVAAAAILAVACGERRGAAPRRRYHGLA